MSGRGVRRLRRARPVVSAALVTCPSLSLTMLLIEPRCRRAALNQRRARVASFPAVFEWPSTINESVNADRTGLCWTYSTYSSRLAAALLGLGWGGGGGRTEFLWCHAFGKGGRMRRKEEEAFVPTLPFTEKNGRRSQSSSDRPFYRVSVSLDGFYWVFIGFTGFYQVSMSLDGFYWVFMGFYWVLPSFGEFGRVLLGFYGILLGFTGFYQVSVSLDGFYWVLLGFTGFYRVSTKFLWGYRVCTEFLCLFTEFTEFHLIYRVTVYSTEFCRVLLGFTEFYRVFLGFIGFD